MSSLTFAPPLPPSPPPPQGTNPHPLPYAPSPANRLETLNQSHDMSDKKPSEHKGKGTDGGPQPEQPKVEFPTSEVPKNPLGEGKVIRTAGCLIIGDEVLNGKTKDTNSNTLAKLLFNVGVDLQRIEVIRDDEGDIVEAARRMVEKYDLVVTSGGIGPTHDDITYECLAKALTPNGKLVYHDETLRRMYEMGKHPYDMSKQSEEQTQARKRMALFPEDAEVLFVQPDLWVPVVRLAGKLCILPGVPSLFTRLLDGLQRYLPLPPIEERSFRHLIHTEMPESSIAPFLTTLQKRVKEEDIHVGSYPKFGVGVDVSLIGRNLDRLRELGQEVVKELNGKVVKEGRIGEEEDVN